MRDGLRRCEGGVVPQELSHGLESAIPRDKLLFFHSNQEAPADDARGVRMGETVRKSLIDNTKGPIITCSLASPAADGEAAGSPSSR